jgi:hypothetical protein
MSILFKAAASPRPANEQSKLTHVAHACRCGCGAPVDPYSVLDMACASYNSSEFSSAMVGKLTCRVPAQNVDFQGSNLAECSTSNPLYHICSLASAINTAYPFR